MKVKKNMSSSPEKATERDPRHLRFRAIATGLTIVVIIGILLLNVVVSALADRYPLAIDLSSDKVFTLSEDSQAFAKSVNNEVEVVVLADPEEFFISFAQYMYAQTQIDFSREMERISREVSTALAQLKSHSNSKITYTFINPDQEPEKYEKYAEYNLGTEYNILFISGERYRKDSLANMIELVDANTLNSNVEKVLISKIYALQGANDHIIQVLTGHSEDRATITGLQKLYESNGYTFEELDITGSAAINDKAELLLIAAPESDYTPEEIHRIDTWLDNDLKRNHHLMVFVNPDKDCPNLYGLLKNKYHIEVTNQKIYESDSNRYFHDGTAYNPAWVWADVPENKYTTTVYGDSIIKAPKARRLLCDLPSSPSSNGGIEEWGLILTQHPDTARVGIIGSDEDKQELKEDQYPLVSGVSYVYESQDNNNENKNATTTVTVFGSAMMAYGMFTTDFSTSNEELLLSVVHAVTGYQTEIAISNKVIAKDVTQFTAGTQMTLGIWIFTIGVPAVVLLIGFVIFLRRRRL